MQDLTKRQRAVLEFIRDFIASDGRPPTLREIARHFRLASTYGVQRHLDALARKGFIEREPGGSRNIRLSPSLREVTGLPLVGQVAAGAPDLAIEHLEGYLPLGEAHHHGKGLYCLRVKGDSMVDAGILPGDVVVVRPEADFADNEIGIAIMDEEATVKRLRRVGRKVELKPANSKYATLRIDPAEREFHYGGKVVGVHRFM
jgi:repressor LexA